MGLFLGDVAYSLRALRKNPGFALTAIITLALGIGATTAIFSVVNAVLLRPLPYLEPDRLVRVSSDMRNRNVIDFPIAPGDFHDLRERMTLFDGIAAFVTGRAVITPVGDSQAQQIRTGQTTPGLFGLLGARMEMGRDFTEAEGTPPPALAPPPGPAQNAAPPPAGPGRQGQPPAAAGGGAPAAPPPAAQRQPPPPARPAILSYEFWQRRFGGDRAILNQVVDLGGPQFEIVGVLAPGFELLLPPSTNTEVVPDVWTAMRANFATASRINVSLRVIGRLKPDASIEQAQGQLDVLAKELRGRFPIKETAGVHFRLTPMAEDLVADVRPGVLALMGAVLFVLLIACANVANLMLVRASARERELAVRAALGGSRSRLIRQMLTESLTLSVIGAMLGLLLASQGIRLLLFLAPRNLPRLAHIDIDPAVLGFTIVAALLSAVVFGMLPAFRASRADVIDVLRKTGRATGLGAGAWVRAAVVITEVALSFVLLVGAGLMIRSFIALQRTDPGFDPKNVLTFLLPNTRRDSPDGRAAFAIELRERLQALPGVLSATAAGPLPQDGGNSLVRWGTEEAMADPSKFQQAIMHAVLPGYFDTMKTAIVEGRGFTEADNRQDARLMIVDSMLAARAFPGQPAVGKRLLARIRTDQPESFEIIGVARHQRHTSLATEGREGLFVPDGYLGHGAAARWAVRAADDPEKLVSMVRAEIAKIDPRVGIVEVQPMMAFIERAQAQTKFALILIGVFAVIALVLAAVGLYGVLSTAVRQRTPEIGVRMAFGAGTGEIFKMMVGQGLRLSAAGLAIGIVGAYWLTGVLRTLLVGVQPTDPATFVAIAVLFLGIAAVASGLPAARAARLDPTTALRDE